MKSDQNIPGSSWDTYIFYIYIHFFLTIKNAPHYQLETFFSISCQSLDLTQNIFREQEDGFK